MYYAKHILAIFSIGEDNLFPNTIFNCRSSELHLTVPRLTSGVCQIRFSSAFCCSKSVYHQSMFLWVFAHSTSFLDEFVHYYRNQAIRLGLFANYLNQHRVFCGTLLDKTPAKWSYGSARKYHWLIEVI